MNIHKNARSTLARRMELVRDILEGRLRPCAAAATYRVSLPTANIVLGGGKKLFAHGSAPHSFKLTRSRVSPNGLIVGHYEREGEIKIGDTELDSPSELEIARRKRMKRKG